MRKTLSQILRFVNIGNASPHIRIQRIPIRLTQRLDPAGIRRGLVPRHQHDAPTRRGELTVTP